MSRERPPSCLHASWKFLGATGMHVLSRLYFLKLAPWACGTGRGLGNVCSLA